MRERGVGGGGGRGGRQTDREACVYVVLVTTLNWSY